MTFEDFKNSIKIPVPNEELKRMFKAFNSNELNKVISWYNSDIYNQIDNLSQTIVKSVTEAKED